MKRFAIVLLTWSLTLSCSKSETYLVYGDVGGADNDEVGEPQDTCWLVGPGEEVFVVELLASTLNDRKSDDCAVDEPFRGGYLDLQLGVLQATDDGAGEKLDAIGVYRWLEGILEWKTGEHAVISVRFSDGTPFVMSFVPVDAVSNEPVSSQPSVSYDLPTSWSALEVEVETTRANHAAQCTEAWQLGPSKSKQMSDEEFATWVRTPAPKPCDSEPVTPEPTDSGDASDF